jgi:hypothetical protein
MNHATYEEYQDTLEMAFLYAKLVTLGLPHWKDSIEVMARNRRIGCSISGIAQFLSARGVHELIRWCDTGYKFLQKYDEHLSNNLLKIP